MLRTLVFSAVLTGLAALAHAQVAVTPEDAAKDPDFKLQGEYVTDSYGVQVIAMGDGQFQAVFYSDGLPSEGWKGQEVERLDLTASELKQKINLSDRVERVSETLGAEPPKGAVVLFDGTKQTFDEHWKPGAKMTDDGLLQQGCTSVDTFDDYTMHMEFRLPYMPKARGQGRGNSGLYHQGRYETQMLDSFGLKGKHNECGGIYSIKDPDLNMCFPPLTWQTYDVDFTAARYDADGNKTANAKLTVKLNGVTIHQDVEVPRITTAAPVKEGPTPGPIYLQDHRNPVLYRNIWVVRK